MTENKDNKSEATTSSSSSKQSSKGETIEIKVKTLDQNDVLIEVSNDITVGEFKALLEKKTNIEKPLQRLIYKGKVLKDDDKLSNYNIESGDAIHLIKNKPRTEQQSSSGSSSPSTNEPNNTQTATANTFQINPNVLMSTIRIPSEADTDVNSILNSVVSSINQGLNRQNTNQQQQQQFPSASNLNSAQIVDSVRRIRNLYQFNNSNMEQLIDLLNRAQSLNNEERETLQTLSLQLSSTFQQFSLLSRRASSVLQNLNIGNQNQQPSSTDTSTTNSSSISVHVHATTSELNSLPAQLRNLEQNIRSNSPSRQPGQIHIHRQQRIITTNNTGTPNNTGNPTVVTSNTTVPNATLNQMNQQVSNNQGRPTNLPPPPVSANRNNNASSNTNNNNNNGQNVPINPSQIFSSMTPLLGNLLGNLNNSTGLNILNRNVNNQNNTNQPSSNTSSNNNNNNNLDDILNDVMESTSSTTTPNDVHSNLANVVEDFGKAMGIDDEEEDRTAFDDLLKVALNELNMGDMMQLMNGNFSSLENARIPLRSHITEKILKKDTSEKSKKAKIEEALKYLKDMFYKNEQLLNEINQRKYERRDLVEDIVQIVRTYARIFIDLILNDKIPSNIPEIDLNLSTVNISFSRSFQTVFELFVGELMDCLILSCKNGEQDAKVILSLLASKVMEKLPENYAMFKTMGQSMIVSLLEKKYKEYKLRYSSRKWSKTPSPTSASTSQSTSLPPVPSHLKKPETTTNRVEDDELENMIDMIDDEMYGTKGKQSKSKKEESDDDIDELLEDAMYGDKKEKEEIPPWTKGLSEDEIKQMKEILKKDEQNMNNRDYSDETLSEAYLKGYKNENKEKSKEKEKKQNNKGTTPTKEEENQDIVDLD